MKGSIPMMNSSKEIYNKNNPYHQYYMISDWCFPPGSLKVDTKLRLPVRKTPITNLVILKIRTVFIINFF